MRYALILLFMAAAQTISADSLKVDGAPITRDTFFPSHIRNPTIFHEDGFYAFGDSQEYFPNRRVLFSANGVEWTTRAKEAPWSPRKGFAAASFLGKLWIIGGVTGEASGVKNVNRHPSNFGDQVWSSVDGADWEPIRAEHPLPWPTRMNPNVAVFKEKLWLIGGQGVDGALSDVWNTHDGVTWTRVSESAPPLMSTGENCVVHDGKLWILTSEENAGAAWSSDDGVNWRKVLHHGPWGDASPKYVTSHLGLLFYFAEETFWVSNDGAAWHAYKHPEQETAYAKSKDNLLVYGTDPRTKTRTALVLPTDGIVDDMKNRVGAPAASSDAPSFESIAWNPAALTPEQQSLYPSVEPRSMNGWQEITTPRVDAEKWQFAPIVWNGELWAITREGRIARTPNGIDWLEQAEPAPFTTTMGVPAYTAAVYRDRLWVFCLQQAAARTQSDYWWIWALWSSTDGENWTSEANRLPPNPHNVDLLSHADALYLVGREKVWRLTDEEAFSTVTDAPEWQRRVGHAVASHGGALYVVGGARSTDSDAPSLADVWKSQDGSHWELLTDSPGFPGRSNATFISYRDHLWLLGGSIGDSEIADAWVSKDGVAWHAISSPAPWSPRAGATATVFKDHLWLSGGTAEYQIEPHRTWITSNGKDWQEPLNPFPWSTREGAKVARFRGAWWMAGGTINDIPTADIWSTANWKDWMRATESAEPFRSHVAHLLATDEALWAVGTYKPHSDNVSPEVWRSPDGANWERVTRITPWAHHKRFDAIVFQNRLWVLGGKDVNEYGEVEQHISDIYVSGDGVLWECAGTLPFGEEERFIKSLNPFVYDDRLWLNPGVSNSNQLWNTRDGKHWESVPMDAPIGDYEHKITLSHEGQLWLVGGFSSSDTFGSYFYHSMESWWRSIDAAHWEILPYCAPVNLFNAIREPQVVSTPTGFVMLDSFAPRVYEWSNERAQNDPFVEGGEQYRSTRSSLTICY